MKQRRYENGRKVRKRKGERDKGREGKNRKDRGTLISNVILRTQIN